VLRHCTAVQVDRNYVDTHGQSEAILKRFTRHNRQHPTYKALSELGRAIKTIFLCSYLSQETVRRVGEVCEQYGRSPGHRCVLAVAALAMLLIHGEDKTLDLVQLLMPFVVFAVPVALLAAATAVFFDATPFLRETAGNVLYFFIWLFMVPAFGGHLLGFEVIEQEMAVALRAQGPTMAAVLSWVYRNR
jgi:hypothetical protein